MISAVTGQQFQIGTGPYRATVTGLGAGLRELLFRGQPVIAGYDADELPPGGAGQLLAPWPNRIDGGRYVFGGAEFQLALTEPEHANAIHGLTRWTAWTPVRHEAGAVVLRSSPHGQEGSGAGDGALFQDIEDRCLKTSRTGGQVLNPAWAAACLTS